MPEIHPTAAIDRRAKLAHDVRVGPFCVVGPDVELGEGVLLHSHVVVSGHTSVGARTRISPFACIGGEPQDRDFAGETTRLAIGRDNVIRENVTIHVGTPAGGGCTRLGNDNLVMNGAHIAHDCQLGSSVTVGAFSGLAGHVTVQDFAVLGSYTGVHQFTRVGESAMTAANSMVSKDAPPFSIVAGDRARWVGLNIVGMKRRGFTPEVVSRLKHAFHLLLHAKLRLEPALALMREEQGDSVEVGRLLAFLETSERGFLR